VLSSVSKRRLENAPRACEDSLKPAPPKAGLNVSHPWPKGPSELGYTFLPTKNPCKLHHFQLFQVERSQCDVVKKAVKLDDENEED
jgi:hypothetical protein